MTVDIDRRPEPIATGRTWRDIPLHPPTEAPARLSPSPEPIAGAGRRSRMWRTATLVGLLALALGIAAGQWAPWQDEAASDASAAQLQSDALGGQPTTTLPPRIVPPPADDPVVPDSVLPEDFFGFEGFPDLSEFFGDSFGRAPGFGTIGPETLSLIALNELPDGYRIAGTSLQSSPGKLTEQLTLQGPSGPVAVRAERSAEAVLPAGASHQVGAFAGVLIEGNSTVFAWEAAPDLLVTIEVPESAATGLLEALVPSVEIVQ